VAAGGLLHYEVGTNLQCDPISGRLFTLSLNILFK